MSWLDKGVAGLPEFSAELEIQQGAIVDLFVGSPSFCRLLLLSSVGCPSMIDLLHVHDIGSLLAIDHFVAAPYSHITALLVLSLIFEI